MVWATSDENLKGVARSLRGRHKDRQIIIAAVDMHMATDNRSLKLAEEATKASEATLLQPPLDAAARDANLVNFADLIAGGEQEKVL